jgi:polar amino acid transport system substrate-binding protein
MRSSRFFARLTVMLSVCVTDTGLNATETTNKATCSRPILIAASPIGRAMMIAPDGNISGTIRDVFDLVAKDTRCVFSYVSVPRARAFLLLKQGEVDIVSSATRSPERDAVARFVQVDSVSPMLISLNRKKLEIGTVEQLVDSAATLLTIRGYDFGPTYRALLQHPKMQARVAETLAPDNAVAMLLAGRADALLMPPLVIVDAWERLGGDDGITVREIEGMATLPYGHYLSNSRMSAADLELVELAIRSVVDRGETRRLLLRYYPRWALDHDKRATATQ